jgi:Ca2+-binding EF-hand superfamily protein
MSEEELVKFCEELFDAVDEDGSGAIDLEEYKRFAQMINKSESDAIKEWQGMNLNEDAELTREALMAYLRSQQATKTAAGDALINV